MQTLSRVLVDSFARGKIKATNSDGYVGRDHASAENFLASDVGEVELLLVDQHMPRRMTGTKLLELLHANHCLPLTLMVSERIDCSIEMRLARIDIKLLAKAAMRQVQVHVPEQPLPMS